MNRCGEGRKMPNNGKMEEQQMRPSANCQLIGHRCSTAGLMWMRVSKPPRAHALCQTAAPHWINCRLLLAHLPLHNIHWVCRIVQRCVWTKRQKLAPLFVYCDRLGLLAVTDEQQHFAQSVCRNKLKISVSFTAVTITFATYIGRLSIATVAPQFLAAAVINSHFGLRRHTLTIKYDNENVPGPTFTFNVTNPPDPLRVKVYGPEFFKGWCRSTDCASEGPKGALNVEMQRDSAQECTSIAIFQFCKLDIVTAWITKSVGPFNQGVIELLEEFTVCKTGDQLSADHARILKQFGHRLAQFRVRLLAR
ncbi:hypothetical protein niasHT_034546 [Heterodera trifolii]|uniref:Uncharacterized protein n=1 Tax=Heterodera trifolii TaxID=157864 RepID=A0ABD2ICC6_9BILA